MFELGNGRSTNRSQRGGPIRPIPRAVSHKLTVVSSTNTHRCAPRSLQLGSLATSLMYRNVCIHRSAWISGSRKLDFRFFGCSEVRQEKFQKILHLGDAFPPVLATVVASADKGGARQPRPSGREIA